ncbi:hypothetical protein XENTR_v10001038 [Xenopus tropicalis]|nr:hypothetical protein XENTR_v10001038 [Xenopus tropicalis]
MVQNVNVKLQSPRAISFHVSNCSKPIRSYSEFKRKTPICTGVHSNKAVRFQPNQPFHVTTETGGVSRT